MIIPGLVSITFRHLEVPDIARLAADCKLRGIEWGGDVHVPVGDVDAATRAAEATAAAGLEVTSYGSYFRPSGAGDPPFTPIADTAAALDAPAIRVWAGRHGSAEARPEARSVVAAALAHAADVAAERGIAVNLEYHENTLADTPASALSLLDEIDSGRVHADPPVRTYYQPGRATPAHEAVEALRQLRDHLAHVHVFSWDADGRRLRLGARQDLWSAIFGELADTSEIYHAQLEHVADDSPEQLRNDAAELLHLIEHAAADSPRGSAEEL